MRTGPAVLAGLFLMTWGAPVAALHELPASPVPIGATVAEAQGAADGAREFLLTSLDEFAAALQDVARNLTEAQRLDNATVEEFGAGLLVKTGGQTGEETGRLVTVGELWKSFGLESSAALGAYAITQVGALASASAPNQRVLVLEPADPPELPDAGDQPVPVTGPATVAHVDRGWYAFRVQLMDLDGARVPLPAFDLDVVGLEALPGHGRFEVPGTVSYGPPVRVAHLLYSTHVNPAASASNGTRLDPAACAGQPLCVALQLPAAALRTERLFAGGEVFLRIRLPDATLAWHSALANLAVNAASSVGATPPLGEGEARRLRSAADQLDQFPTPILLVGPREPASPDPDLDGWPTPTELAWNSDPFDYRSRPGSDDDADGIANFAEASRARAAGWPDDLHESDPVQDVGPLPFAGRTILVSEETPAASHVQTSDVDRLAALPVLEAAVAGGPGTFTLQGITVRNAASRPFEAGNGTGLERLTLLRADDASAPPLASWSFTNSTWSLDEGIPTAVGLECGACGPRTTYWSLTGLQAEGDRSIPLTLLAQVSPRGNQPDAYDGQGFQAELDPVQTLVAGTGGQSLEAVGPIQRAPIQHVDAPAEQLVASAPAATDLVAGQPLVITVCARDAYGNLDGDYGTGMSGFLLASVLQGASPSPSGHRPTPDLQTPKMHRAREGCARVGADLVSESPVADGLTLFRAREETRFLLVDAGSAMMTQTGPLLVGAAAPASMALLEPAAPARGAVPISADAGLVALTVEVRDMYGNPVAGGREVNLTLDETSNAEVTDTAGQVYAQLAASRIAGTTHSVVVTCLDVPALRQELVVVPGAPTRLEARPGAREVRVGASTPLIAAAWDSHGNQVGRVDANWSLVSGEGDVDAELAEFRAPETNGTSIVRAAWGTLTSDARIDVVPADPGKPNDGPRSPTLPAVPQPVLLVLALVGAGGALAARTARVLVVRVESGRRDVKLYAVRRPQVIPRIRAR